MAWLAHAGRSKLDGAPIGSGRFPLGSGKSPFQRLKHRPNYHEDYISAHTRKPIEEMSDSELKKRNARLQEETKYRVAMENSNAGRKFVKKFISTATLISSIAAAVPVYQKYGKVILNAIGDKAVTPVSAIKDAGF